MSKPSLMRQQPSGSLETWFPNENQKTLYWESKSSTILAVVCVNLNNWRSQHILNRVSVRDLSCSRDIYPSCHRFKAAPFLLPKGKTSLAFTSPQTQSTDNCSTLGARIQLCIRLCSGWQRRSSTWQVNACIHCQPDTHSSLFKTFGLFSEAVIRLEIQPFRPSQTEISDDKMVRITWPCPRHF